MYEQGKCYDLIITETVYLFTFNLNGQLSEFQ